MQKKTLVIASLVVGVALAGSINAGGQGQGGGSAPVRIVSPVPLPVTVGGVVPVTVGGVERVSIDTFVSLEIGDFNTEESSVYDVADGKVLIIENIQYDTNAGCLYKYVPTLIADRPNDTGGVTFHRYDLAVVTPDAFTTGGGAFISAATHQVSISVPAGGSVRFGFSRNNAACFGQIRFLVDGRLEVAE
jgi:hypothetical protein